MIYLPNIYVLYLKFKYALIGSIISLKFQK